MANNYVEMVKDDIYAWMDGQQLDYAEFEDVEEFVEWLRDELWTEDSITGNSSGSYTFNSYRAMEYVTENMDEVIEALEEFGTDAETIGQKFLAQDWEWFDVSARCYALAEAVAEYCSECEEEIEREIEEAHGESEEE